MYRPGADRSGVDQTVDQTYLDEVARVLTIFSEDDLTLNATKTHEMLFTIQRRTSIIPHKVHMGSETSFYKATTFTTLLQRFNYRNL